MRIRRPWWLLTFAFIAVFTAGLLERGFHTTIFCHAAWLPSVSAGQKVWLAPVSRKTKTLALTFDDGPKAGVTDRLLDELDKRGVKATFFMIGSQLEGNEAIIKRMYADGHQLGCHTWSHVQMTLLPEQDQQEEILKWYSEISSIVGDFNYCIRPPYGAVNNKVCACLDIPVILWSVDTEDWTGKTAGEIADYIIAEAGDGDIILLHDIFEESVQGAIMALDDLQSKGYTFVTVNELLAIKGIKAEGGKVYRKAVQ